MDDDRGRGGHCDLIPFDPLDGLGQKNRKVVCRRAAEGQAPALPIEELRQLLEESQVLTQDLAGNLEEKKLISQQLLERLDEKINTLTWLLGRAEEVSDRPRPAENTPNVYVKAIELAENGLSLPEIEQQLHLAKGEVQLLLDLKAYCLK